MSDRFDMEEEDWHLEDEFEDYDPEDDWFYDEDDEYDPDEDYYYWDPCIMYEDWCREHPVRAFIENIFSRIRWCTRDIKQGFYEVCPVCKLPERILWHKVGNHSECLPF